MRKKIKLLPHWCQIVGYTYLLAFMISCIYALISSTGIIPDNSITRGIDSVYKYVLSHWNFVSLLNFIMIFLAIFSKEKIEDEMTVSIRQRALVYLAYFLFLIHILTCLQNDTAVCNAVRTVRDFMMQDFGVICICYAVLYKVMLFINQWGVSNEE